MAIDSKELEDFMPATELDWSDTSIARMKNVPFFVDRKVWKICRSPNPLHFTLLTHF